MLAIVARRSRSSSESLFHPKDLHTGAVVFASIFEVSLQQALFGVVGGDDRDDGDDYPDGDDGFGYDYHCCEGWGADGGWDVVVACSVEG